MLFTQPTLTCIWNWNYSGTEDFWGDDIEDESSHDENTVMVMVSQAQNKVSLL